MCDDLLMLEKLTNSGETSALEYLGMWLLESLCKNSSSPSMLHAFWVRSSEGMDSHNSNLCKMQSPIWRAQLDLVSLSVNGH